MPCLLYAVIRARATNLGLTGMARASEFTYQQLGWTWEQLCREDTLTAASASLVDYHHGLPLAREWGAGRLSSSDGQRFAARTRGPGTAALPRYFGHRRRGLQIYSWTSDQFPRIATVVHTGLMSWTLAHCCLSPSAVGREWLPGSRTGVRPSVRSFQGAPSAEWTLCGCS